MSSIPWPLVEIAIEPKSKADQEKLGVALKALAADDPIIRLSIGEENGLTILGGADDLQLGDKISVLQGVYNLEVNVGAPQGAYRETLGRKAEIDFTHKKLDDRGCEFARVRILFEPCQPGKGYSFESRIGGGRVLEEYLPGVRRGLDSAKDAGLLAGFPVIDFTATLIDGAYHDLDSSAAAFEIAAREAFRKLSDQAEPKLLEPVMQVEIVSPEEYVADVIGDLNRRRARIVGSNPRGQDSVVTAVVPLADMFGYADALRSTTEGRATFRMAYDRYEPAPQPPPDGFLPPAVGMRA